MSDFASVLECIERESAERSAFRPTVFLHHAFCAERAPPRGTVRPHEALAAYAESHARDETAPPPNEPNDGALRRAIAAARGDARKLRALRRLAARKLHPDRGGDGAALAECNALIDAALTTSRKRT
ncbi:MAG: hypothetical protein QM651_10880 [Rhodoblastus sp.]